MTTFEQIQAKVQSWEEIRKTAERWQAAGERIVFTNGCFDILHYGHVYYLAQARDLGDRLIIGLNSADSVKRLKGARRPIHDEPTRRHLLASLVFVDALVSFEEDTPYRLIEWIEPDILVKGGDWNPEEIIGSDLVLQKGGQVRSLAFVPGYSTTAIEEKIRNW